MGLTRRTHGVAGEILVQALGDTLRSMSPGETLVARLRDGSAPERPLTLTGIRATHGDRHLVQFAEVRSREEAKRICGAEICVPRARLPRLAADEFYRSDLLGLDVVTETGASLGRVHAFLDLPQHDVLVVRDGQHETLLPMIEDSIHSIDLSAGRIVASPFLGATDEPSGPTVVPGPLGGEI